MRMATQVDAAERQEPTQEVEGNATVDQELHAQSVPADKDESAVGNFDENGQAALDNEVDRVEGSGKMLAEGSTVCFYTGRSQLMIVRNKGKHWELVPLGVSDVAYNAEGTLRLQFYPPEAIFVVMRKGKHVGFRSLVAEGKTLQAMQGDNAPHRVCNYNFGDWESWELTPDGYFNVKWRSKPLGFDVREIRSVAVDMIKGAEKGHLKHARHIQHKLRGTEAKLQDSERKIKDLSRQAERQDKLHQNEIGELRNRLEDALEAMQKLEIEKVQLNANLKQQEMRTSQMNVEKEILETSCAHAEKRLQSLDREIQATRERHEGEMKRMESTHCSEIDAINRERQVELKRTVQHYEAQISKLQDDSQQQHRKKADEVGKLKEVIDNKVKEKDFEISSLMEECSKLNSVLKAIKSQLGEAQMAKACLQATNRKFASTDGRLSPIGGSGRASPDLPGRRSPMRGRPASPLYGRPASPMRGRPASPMRGRPASPLLSRPRSRSPIPDYAGCGLDTSGNLSMSFSKGMGLDRPTNPADPVDSDEEVSTQPMPAQRAYSDMTEASVWSLADQKSRVSFEEEEEQEGTGFQFQRSPSPRQNQRRKNRTVHSNEPDGFESPGQDALGDYMPPRNIDYELVTPRLITPQAAVVRQQRR